MATTAQLQQLYLAYFGRPMDPAGASFYASKTETEVAAAFATSAESIALYGPVFNATTVNAIYMNLFNRPAEAVGVTFWVSLVQAGIINSAQAALSILQGAGPGDSTAVANKLAAANAFTAALDTTAEIAGYNGATATASARAYLSTIDSTAYSVTNLSSKTDQAVINATGVNPTPPVIVPPSPTFTATVTSGTVNFGGTVTGDITVAWSGAVGLSIATFTKGGVSATVSFGASPAATNVTLASTDTLAGTAATLVGLAVSGTGAVKLSDTAANLSGKLFNASIGTHDILTVTDAPTVATDLTSMGGFETINLSGSTGLITIGTGTGTIVNTSAAASVQLGAGGQSFNGSAGDDHVTTGTTTGYGLTGNGGNDTFTVTGNATITDLNTGDSLIVNAGGVGSAINVSQFVATAATISSGTSNITSSSSGSYIDVSLATGPNGFNLSGVGGNDTLIGSSKADTISGGGGTNTLTGGGGADVFTLAPGSTNTITDLSTGDNMTVLSTAIVTANNITAFTAGAITSNEGSVTLNAAAAGATIDVSQATGSKGFTLVGGAGGDSLTGSSKADVLTGGAGVDTFAFGTSNQSTLAEMDTITDYRSATGPNFGALDTINLTNINTAASNINTIQDLSAQGSLESALNFMSNAMTTSSGLGMFIFGGNTYVYVETSGASTTYVAGDTVIKLSGTPFAAGASISGLGIDSV